MVGHLREKARFAALEHLNTYLCIHHQKSHQLFNPGTSHISNYSQPSTLMSPFSPPASTLVCGISPPLPWPKSPPGVTATTFPFSSTNSKLYRLSRCGMALS